MNKKNPDCIFCNIPKDKIILENELAFVIDDKYPHSKGHVLVIPKRHYESYFDSGNEELIALNELLFKSKEFTDEKFRPAGYKISVNNGSAAGQIIMHAHIHLIPGYKN